MLSGLPIFSTKDYKTKNNVINGTAEHFYKI